MNQLQEFELLRKSITGELDSDTLSSISSASNKRVNAKNYALVPAIVCILAFGLVFILLLQHMDTILNSDRGVAAFCIVFIVIFLGPIWWMNFKVSKDQRASLAHEVLLRNIRPNLCLICGYNLHGTTAEACPECGTALAPVEAETAED